MRILILEDSENRIKKFESVLLNTTMDICRTAEEAIELVNTNKYDLMFLDHDLGGMVFVDSYQEDTGYQVAKIIPDSINKDTQVIVHSLNPAGAKLMVETIGKTAKHIPFIMLKFGGY